jgi:hypothetical protein
LFLRGCRAWTCMKVAFLPIGGGLGAQPFDPDFSPFDLHFRWVRRIV